MESNRQHRDIQCADDVRLMAKMRRFDQEFTVYGTTEWRKGDEVRYLATANLEKLFAYIERRKIEDSYFTPVEIFSKRTPMPSGMEEVLQLAAKYTLLGQMKNAYETVGYFECMEDFFRAQGNDSGFPILERFRKEIDGYFEDHSLQLLSGFVRWAYEAKVLSNEHLWYFLNWCDDAYRQIEDRPVAGDKFNRTFYGFIYYENLQDENAQMFYDAEKTEVITKWNQTIIKGWNVGPILKKTIYFHRFDQLKQARVNFKDWLQKDQNTVRELLFAIKCLPGVVDHSVLGTALRQCEANEKAMRAVCYYKNVTNRF